MGHSAKKTPSKLAVTASSTSIFQIKIAIRNVIKNAIGQALCPGILIFPRDIISQIIGIQATKNNKFTFIPPLF
ncbi:hypothetical protein CNEO4_130055 [Clostridium neonatale]|nr:hypothetical protein CNEO4_130055 [Clostridium neonatale]